MKRILLALGQEQLNRKAVDFACYLAKLTHSKVTGMFLQDFEPARQLLDNYLEQVDKDLRQKPTACPDVSFFREACERRESGYAVYKESNIKIDTLLQETLFADMLVINPEFSLKYSFEAAPTSAVKNILGHADCPVILVPESFDRIDEVIFTYDGSKSSMFAIKQFTYLFPEFRNNRIILLEVNEDGDNRIVKENQLMEWLDTHYAHVAYVVLGGKAEQKISTFLLTHHHAFVVMGAYGRNYLSRLVKPSTIESIAGIIINPIFITHC